MLTYRIHRRVPTLATLGVGVEYFPGYVNRRVNLHALDAVLLSFILRGRGQHIIDGETFDEGGGSLAVTHYGQRHDILTDAQGMDVMNVYLDLRNVPLPPLPGELQQVLPLLLPLHPGFRHRLNRIVRLQFDDPQPAAALLFGMRREVQQREAGYEDAMRLQFKLFLMLCCRQVLKRGVVPHGVDGARPEARLERLRGYLDERYAEPHTLAALACRAGLSRTYLCRAFKAYTGKPVFDYLIQRRVQAAMMRLRGGNEKILQIALECGFNDLAYFNRKFKELLGQTPTAYRRAAAQVPSFRA
ncbi:MAG: AraC family transcriptional regulator [Lentisphaerae bacterium]|nr:AraC family transcriptional regulator [Lentisphaerota bacterium]